MRRSGKKPPLVLLRAILLSVMVIVVGGLAGLYFIGRASRPVPPALEEQVEAGTTGELLRGEGFEHEVTREGKKIFVIRANRIASDEEDHFRLEGVELVFERDSGDQYTIQSDWSTYDRDTDAAVLNGNVRLIGPNNLTLTTSGLELKKQGTLIVSTTPVIFGIAGEYEGEAGFISINLKRDEFSLTRDVKLQLLSSSTDRLSLECDKLSFERRKHLLRVEGSVDIKGSNENRLRARRLSILLAEDEKVPRFLRARWDLRGKLRQVAGGGSFELIDFEGEELSITFEEGSRQARKIELEGTAREPAQLQIKDGTSGTSRTIRSKYLIGEMSRGSIQSVQLLREVSVEEHQRGDAPGDLRRASGQIGVAKFGADGGLESFLLDKKVKLEQPNLKATGVRLEANLSSGETVLLGNPVELMTDQGSLAAPRVVYSSNTDNIQAFEGVKAVLEGSKGPRLWGAEEPAKSIQVESESADWNDGLMEFRFLDKVKAWQGGSYLLANEMVFSTAEDNLAASGSVRTVWRPLEDSAKDSTEPSGSPIEVNADDLVYSKTDQILIYSGSARFRQDARTLSCETMKLTTSAIDTIEKLDCEGRARLEDLSSGKTVEGDLIAYRPEFDFARISGAAVILRDQQGTQIQGKQLRYNLLDGTATLESASSTLDPADPASTLPKE